MSVFHPTCMENIRTGAREKAGVMLGIENESPREQATEKNLNEVGRGSEILEPILEKDIGPTTLKPGPQSNNFGEMGLDLLRTQSQMEVCEGQNVNKKVMGKNKGGNYHSREHAGMSSRSHQGNRTKPISLKIKDRLWGTRNKQQYVQVVPKVQEVSKAKSFEGKKREDPKQRNSVASEELQNLIEVGGLMGYNLVGHENLARVVINGEEIQRDTQ
ncbi:hypothetical protein QVD17_07582 [Tagetes erecta]|uniref:Uncharacterized protein n=1 Tax=Tagetes erecta TaxID=13708 RepID=A0AAD8LLD6_TARER|nr:hypothetical protein QVD17_07582 [Tagetes erecta]